MKQGFLLLIIFDAKLMGVLWLVIISKTSSLYAFNQNVTFPLMLCAHLCWQNKHTGSMMTFSFLFPTSCSSNNNNTTLFYC